MNIDQQIRACDMRIQANQATRVARRLAEASYRPDWSAIRTPHRLASKTIVKQLVNARNWLPLSSVRKDKILLEELVCGCLKILQQSCNTYWASRHAAVRLFDRAAILKLVNLTLSEVEASPVEYEPVWQFEQFSGNLKLAKSAKRAMECICTQCSKKFHPERKAVFCSPECRKRANYQKRKLDAKTPKNGILDPGAI